MGVPSFYRWLIQRYPLILQDVIEEEPLDVNGVTIPVNTTKPNPNGETDNLYLDMNGIIHPCFHPEDKPSPTTFSEVFKCMFDYIDRIFVMVRPRKLLYLAIDGVAPRAKMNQQRSRRFRAAKDAAEAAAEEERLREAFENEGKRLPPKVNSEVFDSNVITPGTEFMSTLSFALQYYIHIRLNSDPGWKNIKVILSDANVPGEGEHKIMSYIRLQKNHPGYDPNTHHSLYGLDADLIMLALATHEVNVSILREVVFTPGEKDKCFLCGQIGHRAADCKGKIKRKAGDMFGNTETDVVVKKPYQFVNIWILREYLEKDMQIPNSRSPKLLDRIIDDFIFICFFVGNDFLPHMPTLEIKEGAIELLMSVYKNEFGSTESYLSDRSKLNLKNVEHFIQAVGIFENNIFLRRAQAHQRQSERFSRLGKAQARIKNRTDQVVKLDSLDEVSDSLHSSPPRKLLRRSLDDDIGVANVETENSIKAEELDNGEELKFELKKLLLEKNDGFSSGNGDQDKVKLGVSGWRERYYEEKFTAQSVEEMEQIRRDVVLKYTEGLCWIMNYYYHGVCSWNWFYPYHYAPFASDLKFLDKLDIKFELGSPFKPFNQLLAVLPSASAHALPECFRTLMTDPNSPIADFYPSDFEIDMNGKRFSWQGIAKLPFIEETRLLDAAARVEQSLTKEEIRRNSVLFDMLFVVASHPLAELIRSLNSRTNKLSNEERATTMEKIDPALSEGMNGYIASCGGDSQPPCFSSPIEGMEDVLANQVICAIYKVPDECNDITLPDELRGNDITLPDELRGNDITHSTHRMVLRKRTVQQVDLKGGANLWHEDGGRRRGPRKIIKIKRYNPEGSITGNRLGNAAHRLVLQTINALADSTHINKPEAELCPNTIFQNKLVPKKAPTFEKGNGKKGVSLCEITSIKQVQNKSPTFQGNGKKGVLLHGTTSKKKQSHQSKQQRKITVEKKRKLQIQFQRSRNVTTKEVKKKEKKESPQRKVYHKKEEKKIRFREIISVENIIESKRLRSGTTEFDMKKNQSIGKLFEKKQKIFSGRTTEGNTKKNETLGLAKEDVKKNESLNLAKEDVKKNESLSLAKEDVKKNESLGEEKLARKGPKRKCRESYLDAEKIKKAKLTISQ